MADEELPGGWLPPRPPEPERPERPIFVKEDAPTEGLQITAIVCAVTSMALLVLSLGLSFLISLPLGLIGWLCAARSSRPGAGRTLAIVAVVLSVVAAAAWLVLVLAGFSPDELQHDLERELERQRQSS